MRWLRRAIVPTVLVLLVVAVAVLGLAAMALLALPLAIVLEVTVLALVAGTGMRLRRMRRPRREGARAGPRWTAGWESGRSPTPSRSCGAGSPSSWTSGA